MAFQRLITPILLLASPLLVFCRHFEHLNSNDGTDLHRRLADTKMPVFVTVIDSSTDITELCYTFQTLVRAKGFPTAPILAFHGLYLDDTTLDMLQGCSTRQVTFVDITAFYHVFPENFVPTPGVNYDKQHTERFFITDLWGLPHVEAHDIIFRITDASCFTLDNYDLPDFPSNLPVGFTKEALMYQTQMIPGSFVMGYRNIAGLYDSTFEFISANSVHPKNPALWSIVVRHNEEYNSLPKFENSFEIVRKEFMIREDVRAYHDYMINSHANEFYNNMWSSEVLRFMTMAIFGAYEETYVMHVSGYMEKDFLNQKRYPGVCRIGPLGTSPLVTA